jgi:hypothetical protein
LRRRRVEQGKFDKSNIDARRDKQPIGLLDGEGVAYHGRCVDTDAAYRRPRRSALSPG